MPAPHDISARKADHLTLCTDGDVGFVHKTALWDELDFVHDALPELAVDQVDLGVDWLGKRLAVPLVIAAMTGGTERAEAVNRDLAAAAEAHGLGFCFGSQRPLLTRGIEIGYRVRDVAPTALIVGNIGVVQASSVTTERLRELVLFSGADALAIHLNPGQEMAQPEGDRDFRGGLDTIRRVVSELGLPVLVKETGCGLSRQVGERLVAAGVRWLDTGGAGGTSWIAVEMHRADAEARAPAERFRDWGIPTAASLAALATLPVAVCATGGVADGLDAAKALALGAACVGVARPLLQAQAQGADALDHAIRTLIAELRMAMVLVGARDLAALRQVPLIVGPTLLRWAPALAHRRG
ncbi:MAG: type 2 isopentenyl-diphosphate Delta-isomerase [Myxococcales bacterium]|nr:type 2 isopentenyl-diphosphate Delta-isomerase [Myxococcales bacterium]